MNPIRRREFHEEAWHYVREEDDAKAALAALDEVMKVHKVDKDRVVLTGLSMGGSGSWGIAAKYPERFSAVVPICGRGRVETVDALKRLPAWFVVGDDDRARTVRSGRSMIARLREANDDARLTEYLSVGHNSWDRGYNDLVLLDWMLAQSRRGRTNQGGIAR